MQIVNYNPIQEVIDKLEEKSINSSSKQFSKLVLFEDAVKAIEEVELRVLSYCEEEIRKKEINNRFYY